jgi:hypothetical protein
LHFGFSWSSADKPAPSSFAFCSFIAIFALAWLKLTDWLTAIQRVKGMQEFDVRAVLDLDNVSNPVLALLCELYIQLTPAAQAEEDTANSSNDSSGFVLPVTVFAFCVMSSGSL